MTMKIRIIRNVKTLRESNKTHICRGNPERKSLFKNVFVRTCLLILSTDFQSSCCDNYRSFCKHDSDALEHTMIERVDRLHRYIPLLTVK